MLEKIGLPAKPSMRGGNWVVDASHCQGCSSQFTLINRKHHCRRCGGLFCNNCTMQRMVLRGQGDSPVRICDPCKKIEDAARFELRYGKNRASKGTPKTSTKQEDELLNQIIGVKKSQPQLPAKDSTESLLSELGLFDPTASSSSNPSITETDDIIRSISLDASKNAPNDISNTTPEELRERAKEEKKKHRILKAEGKPNEALQAFKRGRELERQADALEIALRKNRRLGIKNPSISTSNSSPSISTSNSSPSISTCNSSSSNMEKSNKNNKKDKKDDLASELRELGWSDADLHENEVKPRNLTVEGELSQLIGEITETPSVPKKLVDNSQVIALKKRALLLKREGKLDEAKEELKKAKILEKKLEEEQILGGAESEESDDELAALIRGMDNEKHDKNNLNFDLNQGLNFNKIAQFGALDSDFGDFAEFNVTEDDLNDPEMDSVLKSFGWTDEQENKNDTPEISHNLVHESIVDQVRTLKREAVIQKKAGNLTEAMSLFKKAKLLEKETETEIQISPEKEQTLTLKLEPNPKSKLAIQRELIAVKKRALALRREGKMDESDEELKRGKLLEELLEQMEKSTKIPPKIPEIKENRMSPIELETEEVTETEVTETDMQDPALLSVLKNLGWNEEEENNNENYKNAPGLVSQKRVKRSKGEIQRELLAIKRKALKLRREGKIEESDAELEKAKDLENQINEIEREQNNNNNNRIINNEGNPLFVPSETQVTVKPVHVSEEIFESDADVAVPAYDNENNGNDENAPSVVKVVRSKGEIQRELLTIKRKALQLRREGKIEESEMELEKSKDLEKQITEIGKEEELNNKFFENNDSKLLVIEENPPIVPFEPVETQVQETEQIVEPVALSVNNLKNEVLLHKKKALALKREGKLAEAREELKQAKLLEKKLLEEEQEDEQSQQPTFINTQESNPSPNPNPNPNPGPNPYPNPSRSQPRKPVSSRDRFKLQQESLSRKRNALKLRRDGKIDESEREFELAKELEKQLEEIGGGNSQTSNINDGVTVEDFLDPQLMSALRSIGWDEPDLGKVKEVEREVKTSTSVGSKIDERASIEEEIKREKIRALNLKREGKQAEALEALRSAKRLEKKLATL